MQSPVAITGALATAIVMAVVLAIASAFQGPRLAEALAAARMGQ